MGQALKNHREKGIAVHLFSRRTGKIDGRAAPFIYCGVLEFMNWRGEKPITVTWKLRDRVPESWFKQIAT